MSKRVWFFELLLLVIITVPAFLSLLNGQYFSMHDDQHIARLYLLDQGIRQGYLFPRWVGGLGFGYGYPLYNFYPPLVYYIAEVFHLVGLSYIWSIKLTFILGFLLAAGGIYLLVKRLTKNKLASFLSSSLYIYFFYHSVLIYVRGALAEFFSLAILPFLFLALHSLAEKLDVKRSVLFGIVFALLILNHPLIAFPSLLFLAFCILFYFLRATKRFIFLQRVLFGGVIGLSLSAFFWLPAMLERKFTFIDQILTSELASYKLHFIYPSQFLYSPWGYGGSVPGLGDGMTFQLGKIHIAAVIVSLFLSLLYFIKKRKWSDDLALFYFFVFLLGFSLFMTTEISSFVWDRIRYLWYLQFPWRFLTFTALFISISGAYCIVFLYKLLKNFAGGCSLLLTGIIILTTIGIYQKYFRPQKFIETNDVERTSFEEIAWRISGTSYEFVPKGVKTAKSQLGTTILDIKKENLPRGPYQVVPNEIAVQVQKNEFAEKRFSVKAYRASSFRLNTYNFPGWKAYIDSRQVRIDDKNDFKLITVQIPGGSHAATFIFEDTPVRRIANLISVFSLAALLFLLSFQFKKVDR